MHVDRKPPPGSATSYAILTYSSTIFSYFHGIISSMHVLFAGGSANHKVTTSKITSTASPPAKITQKRIYKEASPSPIPPMITQPAQYPASSVVITIITQPVHPPQPAQWSSSSASTNQLSGHQHKTPSTLRSSQHQ
jgi:hypothetical protein